MDRRPSSGEQPDHHHHVHDLRPQPDAARHVRHQPQLAELVDGDGQHERHRRTQNQWKNLYTWTNPKAGRYYVRVLTTRGAETTNSRGSNGFVPAGRTPASSFTTCSAPSRPRRNYSANCPQLHAVSDMSIYRQPGRDRSDRATSTWPRSIPSTPARRCASTCSTPVRVRRSLQILDPNGNPATFSWSTPCSPQTPPYGGCCGGQRPSLDVSDAGVSEWHRVPSPTRASTASSKYSDRFLTIDIPLPSNYTTVYGTQGVVEGAVHTSAIESTDRTTWSVNIVGDPVHLLN